MPARTKAHRMLQRQFNSVTENYDQLTRDYAEIRRENETLDKENAALVTKMQQRIDLSMLTERRQLCSQVGQMVEACAKMIHVVVGKEVM